jgi:hypothetical protein
VDTQFARDLALAGMVKVFSGLWLLAIAVALFLLARRGKCHSLL